MDKISTEKSELSDFPKGSGTSINAKTDVKRNDTQKNLQSYDLVVFCHLRWDFVYQRPQHIISRLSKKYSTLMVEEPIPFHEEEKFGYDLEEISPTLHILKPKVHSIAEISQVLEKLSVSKSALIGWFYSAAFSVLIPDFDFETIVYDCMDELSLFKGAPKELVEQEKYLMAKADIVFTGGRALYEAKNQSHYSVHSFPSSVDRAHFEKAKNDISIPEDIKNIDDPIVGYMGVIDERLDLGLLQSTAQKLPHVSFVMIGPLAKIGEEDLPREENIHFLGLKSYNELPNYLKAFDIAMMPFALNDATKYISPTKTLEYMAAGIPIVSTAVKDVVRFYENCIYIIANTDDFVTTIKKIINRNPDERETDFDSILSNTSWDATVEKMDNLITRLEK